MITSSLCNVECDTLDVFSTSQPLYYFISLLKPVETVIFDSILMLHEHLQSNKSNDTVRCSKAFCSLYMFLLICNRCEFRNH